MSNQSAFEWFKEEAWSEGINIKAKSGINISEFYSQYHNRPDLWKLAFGFLKEDLASKPVGTFVIKENELKAIISEYDTKIPGDAKWESHRKFIDLQYVINGKEKMGLLPLDKAILHEEYQPENDLIFFGEQEGDYSIATPEVYYLFFPQDVHRPGLQVNGSEKVKKLVIKIAYFE